MKTLITSLLLSAALFVGCMDDSSLLTAPDTSTNPQTNAPAWIQQPDGSQLGFGPATNYSPNTLGGKKGGGGNRDSINIKDRDKDDDPTRYGFTR